MKKYCKCNISPKKVLQYCKWCNKQYFANTLFGQRPRTGYKALKEFSAISMSTSALLRPDTERA